MTPRAKAEKLVLLSRIKSVSCGQLRSAIVYAMDAYANERLEEAARLADVCNSNVAQKIRELKKEAS